MDDLLLIPKVKIFGTTFFIRVNFDDTHFNLKEDIDDFRMHLAKDTVRYLSQNGGKLILFNHLGRPKAKLHKHLKTDRITKAFSKLLKKPIIKIDGEIDEKGDFKLIGNKTKDIVLKMKPGDLVMLENTRFDARETSSDKKLRLSLAHDMVSLVKPRKAVFVLDGFPICHRDNTSSITEIAELIPGVKGAWQKYEEEQHNEFLGLLTSRNPQKRFTAIFGGNKVDKKFEISLFASRHLKKGDYLIFAGRYPDKLLNTKVETALIKKGVHILKPLDYARKRKDIGPLTVNKIKSIIDQTNILFWEGPLGKFEEKPFHKGSHRIVKYIVECMQKENTKLKRVFISGGELGWLTKTALQWKHKHINSIKGFTISTGGGASIAYLGNNGRSVAEKYLKGFNFSV